MQLNISLPDSFSEELQETVTRTVEETIAKMSNNSSYPDWFDKGTAAKFIGVSRVTFDKILKKYDVPYTMLNGSYFFNKVELNKWLLDHSNK